MTLQAINNVMMQLQINHSSTTPQNTVEDKPITPSTRTITPVSYTTADGGLFVGYYLNIHG